MSESAPSIDPKTLAIGAAVVVAGVGAYLLLREGSGTGSSNQVLPGEKDDCPVDPRTGAIEKVSGVANVIMGPFVGIIASVAAKFATQTPSMEELNSLRTDAFNAGKAAIASGDYSGASKQYTTLIAYERQVQDNRAASSLASHEKDPFCKNPLSAQLLKLMMPLITDKLTKEYTAILDTAEANINAGNFAVARGNLFTLSQTYGFDKYWSIGGGSTESFMVPIKQRRDALMARIEAGEAKVDAQMTQTFIQKTVTQAVQNRNLADRLSPDAKKWFNIIAPAYDLYMADNNNPDLVRRQAVAKAIAQLPDWFTLIPDRQGYIDRTMAEVDAKVKPVLAGAASTLKTVGAGLEHLLSQNAVNIMVDQYFRWTPAQQKQYVDGLTPDQKKMFMNQIRQAKMDRVNNGT